MTLFLIYAFQWFLVALFFTVFILLCMWTWTTFRAKVPFVPVPNSILDEIHKTLQIQEGSVVYDLGCGDGRILFHSARITPKATYIGIDNNPFAVFLARARGWWYTRKTNTKVQILNQDFFKRDLSDATHIFTYLYPSVMDDLLPKLDEELKPGTRLVSTTFQFTVKRPIAEIDLGRNPRALARKLYVYEF